MNVDGNMVLEEPNLVVSWNAWQNTGPYAQKQAFLSDFGFSQDSLKQKVELRLGKNDNVLARKLFIKRNIEKYLLCSSSNCKFCSKPTTNPHWEVKTILQDKYLQGMDYYNVKVVNDIIYNDDTHLVSLFKDYLILDDISEFLKRYYRKDESKPWLTKIYQFYD